MKFQVCDAQTFIQPCVFRGGMTRKRWGCHPRTSATRFFELVQWDHLWFLLDVSVGVKSERHIPVCRTGGFQTAHQGSSLVPWKDFYSAKRSANYVPDVFCEVRYSCLCLFSCGKCGCKCGLVFLCCSYVSIGCRMSLVQTVSAVVHLAMAVVDVRSAGDWWDAATNRSEMGSSCQDVSALFFLQSIRL